MHYELRIDGSPILSGSALEGALIVALVVVCILFLLYATRRRYLENETFKYEFITIIAHKFRTPLTTVKWLLEGLMSEEKDPYRKGSLSDIRQSNEKLIALTGTLIELTNVDNETAASYKMEVVPFCDFVKSVAEAHKNSFHQKNQFMGIKCEAPDLKVMVDKSRMEFVLQTLFENAFSYTPPGRNIDIAVRRSGRHAVVSVTDQGIGIAAEDIPKIFTKFYRTENARRVDTEGFGVGLFLARSIVLRHHGELTVSSEGLDKGTTFTVTLPARRH